MLIGVFGLIGSGKSLLLADIATNGIINKNPFKGRFGEFSGKYDKVYTNFPLNGAFQLDFDALGVYDFRHCLIVIDEIQLYADSRNFREFPDSLKNFFSVSRHYHSDIIYASQSYDHADKRIRSLTEKYYHVTRGIMGYMKIQEIVKYMRCENGIISEGYCYAPQVKDLYFRYKKLYGRIDTYSEFFEYLPNNSIRWDELKTYDFPSYL